MWWKITAAAVGVEHAGSFNVSGTGERWKPFTSSQRVVTRRPGFVWDARVRMAPATSLFVHDAYVAGDGVLTAGLFGLMTVMDQPRTPELAHGELMRFFAEAAWYPTALLPSQGVAWEPIDGDRAVAELRDGATTVRLVFEFDDLGLNQLGALRGTVPGGGRRAGAHPLAGPFLGLPAARWHADPPGGGGGLGPGVGERARNGNLAYGRNGGSGHEQEGTRRPWKSGAAAWAAGRFPVRAGRGMPPFFRALGEEAMYLAVGTFFLRYLESRLKFSPRESDPWLRYCRIVELFTSYRFFSYVELEELSDGRYWMLEKDQYAGRVWAGQKSWERGTAPCPLWSVVMASLEDIGYGIALEEVRYVQEGGGFESTFHHRDGGRDGQAAAALRRQHLLRLR